MDTSTRAVTATTDVRPERRRKARRARPSRPARVVGYVIGAAVNVAWLVLIDVAPGWDALPFLTGETTQVLPWINASVVASLVANVVYLARDPSWLRGLGDAVTAAFALAATLRVWSVFPFHFDEGGFDWALLFRVGLVLTIVGCAVGIVVGLVTFVRESGRHG